MSGSRGALTLIMILAIVVGAGSPALAKGASSATVSGPGIEEPIELFNYWTWDPGNRDLVGRLMEHTSVWYASNSVVAIERPDELDGQPYRLTWFMAGPGGYEDRVIHQFIYLADSGPVVHVPEQPGLEDWGRVAGWYQAPQDLVDTLVALGVPVDIPVPGDVIAAGVAFVVLVAGFILVNSRRSPVVSYIGGDMRTAVVAIATLALVVATATVAWAGGWAVTTVDSMPDGFEPGETYTIDYTILQHGKTPADAGDSYLTFVDTTSNDRLRFDAVNLGDGRYRAEVTLPTSGTWQFEVEQGWFGTQQLGLVEVGEAVSASATDGNTMQILRVILPLATVAAAALTIGELMRMRKTTPSTEAG